MTDPNPGAPLTDDEQRSWVTAVDKITGHYLGDLTLPQIEELVASVRERSGPGEEWADQVADAVRERWRIQRGEHLAAVWERVKRTSEPPGG